MVVNDPITPIFFSSLVIDKYLSLERWQMYNATGGMFPAIEPLESLWNRCTVVSPLVMRRAQTDGKVSHECNQGDNNMLHIFFSFLGFALCT